MCSACVSVHRVFACPGAILNRYNKWDLSFLWPHIFLVFFEELVDFHGHNEVIFVQTLNFLGLQRNGCVAPAK